MHGGTVSAFSAGAGHGSAFEVHIPVMVPTNTTVTHASAPVREKSHRILVVDDNVDSTRSMATLLSLKKHDVRTALDGETALEILSDFRAALVLLDIGLPRLSGYNVAREIRQRDWGKHIVLCAMTGYGQDQDRRRARQAGFDHHLIKPVDTATLYDIIRNLRPAPELQTR